MMPLNTYCGMEVIPDSYMVDTVYEQFRFPRSKKKRMRKKWAKDPHNWRTRSVPWDKAYVLGKQILVAHPEMIDRIQRQVEDAIERKALCDIPQLVGLPLTRVANTASTTQDITQLLELLRARATPPRFWGFDLAFSPFRPTASLFC